MDYATIITLAAKKVGVSAVLLLAICSHESGLKNVDNENDKGTPSIGVCQVKVDTARMFGFKGDRYALQNPRINAMYAARYLKKQMDEYQNILMALAAYNSGTYFESKKKPGCPKNLKYVNKVKKFVTDETIALQLECGYNKMAEGF